MTDPQRQSEVALIAAIETRNVFGVRRWLEANVNPNTHDDQGRHVLVRAADEGNLEILRLLFDHGAVLENDRIHFHEIPLQIASSKGHLEIVRELLMRGALVDQVDDGGNSALMYAALAGKDSIVRLLLDHGADFDIRNANGWNARHMAEGYHFTAIINIIDTETTRRAEAEKQRVQAQAEASHKLAAERQAGLPKHPKLRILKP